MKRRPEEALRQLPIREFRVSELDRNIDDMYGACSEIGFCTTRQRPFFVVDYSGAEELQHTDISFDSYKSTYLLRPCVTMHV